MAGINRIRTRCVCSARSRIEFLNRREGLWGRSSRFRKRDARCAKRRRRRHTSPRQLSFYRWFALNVHTTCLRALKAGPSNPRPAASAAGARHHHENLARRSRYIAITSLGAAPLCTSLELGGCANGDFGGVKSGLVTDDIHAGVGTTAALGNDTPVSAAAVTPVGNDSAGRNRSAITAACIGPPAEPRWLPASCLARVKTPGRR